MTFWPVSEPIFTGVLLDEIMTADVEAGPKAKAMDTPFRYSDAGKCARAMSYGAVGVERSNPPKGGDLWPMWLGTLLHEKVQEALARKFPGMRFESKTSLGLTSGHSDGDADADVILRVHGWWEGGTVTYELKTMGGWAFKKAVGLKQRKTKTGGTMNVLEDPAGPRRSAIIQASLNALANDSDTMVLGILAMENVSKGIAENGNLRDIDRFMAEWHFPRDVYEPIARAELVRQQGIIDRLDTETLGKRVAIDDDGNPESLKPENKKQHWMCQYCSYVDQCLDDGPDPAPVPVEFRAKESA